MGYELWKSTLRAMSRSFRIRSSSLNKHNRKKNRCCCNDLAGELLRCCFYELPTNMPHCHAHSFAQWWTQKHMVLPEFYGFARRGLSLPSAV